MVAIAKARIDRASDGDDSAAREILRQSAVGLRDVLSGREPDPERLVYLHYLCGAIDKIAQGAPADKALGTYTDRRPKRVDDLRDMNLFVAVGLEYERVERVGIAQENVSAQYGIGFETVKRAWKLHGGLRSWRELGPHERKTRWVEELIELRNAALQKLNSLPPGNDRRRVQQIAELNPAEFLPKAGKKTRP